MRLFFIGLTSCILIASASCKKKAGPGGRASVKGKVYAYDWDNTQLFKVSEGYSSGERVYILYGDNTTIGNDVRTSIDGSFEFKYLNKGRYKLFVNSLDTAYKIKGNDTYIPIIREFEITNAKSVISLDDIVINK
ncbi:MAG: hypothetical protein HY062_14785 [Bacteroidetes bacterium]|nr:hypothetical protein [Bacteroidota bacterium]